MLVKTLVVIGLLICASSAVAQSASPVSAAVPAPPRNLILFVADGLRHNSVNPDAAPTAIHDIAEIRAPLNDLQPTSATIIDDATGPQGIPLPQNVREEMNASGLPASAPDRSNGHEPSSRHNNGRPGTLAANFYQQQ